MPACFHRADQATWHRADVGAAMTANFGFVAHTTQADPDELTVHVPRDRATETGLADAWRAGQAEDLGGAVAFVCLALAQLAHGKEIEDPFLDLFSP